jgi:TIR domain/AAA ATPase domain
MYNPTAVLFLSYAAADEQLASDIKDYLETQINGVTVFMASQSIKRGEEWEKRLHMNLKESFAVVPIITPNWLESRWCFGEWVAASVLGATILPFVEETVELRAELSRIQHRKFSMQRPAFEGLKRDVEPHFSQHRATRNLNEPPFPYAFRYEPEHAATFRGREKEVDKIVTQLNAMRHSHDGRGLLVHGTSGSGKSSLVRAGVYPKIICMPKLWVAAALFKTSRDPFTQMLERLTASFTGSANERPMQDAVKSFRDPSRTDFDETWQRIVGFLDKRTLVLIVDNLDRYFSSGTEESERFLMLVGSAIRDRSINVIGVLRSDQLNRASAALKISSSDYDTMSVEPAEPQVLISSLNAVLSEKGYEFDPGLIHTMYVDIGASMEAWPFIGRCLYNLWLNSKHKRTAFKLDNYRKKGGIAAQIRSDLDAVEAALGPNIEEFFNFLAIEGVSHVEGDEIVPRSIPRARICKEYERAIDLLEQRCLFVAGANNATGEAVTQVVPAVIEKYWDGARIVDRVHAMEEVREARRAAQYWSRKGRQLEWLVHRGGRLLRVKEYIEPRRLRDFELNDYLEECEKHFR